MKEVYIRFMSSVTAQSAEKLIRILETKMRQGYSKVHLLLSTLGGSVYHGLSLYNYLKGIPLEVATYNFGNVDSIGVIIFCAGKERFSVPNARFLIHMVTMAIQGNVNIELDENKIDEILKSLRIDKVNIAKTIAQTTNKKQEDIEHLIHDRTTWTPEIAKENGLVTDIKIELLPKGCEFETISEFDTVNQPQQIIPQFFMPNPMSLQRPSNNEITNYFNKSYVETKF